MTNQSILGKKIALIIAFRGFRDVEYFVPKDILSQAGAEITTISTQPGQAVGADGGEVEVNLSAAEARAEDFDAIVFIGGPGMVQHLDNEEFQQLARQAASAGKVLGAICIAPALLAKADLLKGKRATVWSSPLDKSAVKLLKEKGADYLSAGVVVDDRVVTASGPPAAGEFAEKLIEVLK